MWKDDGLQLEKIFTWVNKIHKYGNLKHMRMASRNMSIIQYFLLDVMLFLLVVSLIPGLLFYYLFCRRKKKSKID